MKVLSLSYNPYLGRYIFVDHPVPSSSAGRYESNDLEGLFKHVDSFMKERRKNRIAINLDESLKGEDILRIRDYFGKRPYRADFKGK